MNERDAESLLAEISQKKSFVPKYSNLSPPRVIQCSVSPSVEWNRSETESTLGMLLPKDLVELWNHASEVRLNEDIYYGQWGCVLWSPLDLVERHHMHVGFRGEGNFRLGDLIIGEFLGDSDLVVQRCDRSCADFGSVVIALPMDSRDEWPVVAPSIWHFMSMYLHHPSHKFWESFS